MILELASARLATAMVNIYVCAKKHKRNMYTLMKQIFLDIGL